MIIFDASLKLFHLRTRACSYVLQVQPSGHLAHLYWGAPVRDGRLTHLLVNRDRAFSPRTASTPHSASTPHGFSLDTLPQECPGYGSSDFRSPAIAVTLANGSAVSEFLYQGHRILPGKTPLEGLPATYVENADEADTLEIDLLDEVSGLQVTLIYSAFGELGALTRTVRLTNTSSQTQVITRCLSASVDFPTADFDFIQLAGAWARERDVHRQPLRPGIQSIESRRGASGHEHNPFFALAAPDTTEDRGEVYAFNLVYSGSFCALAEVGLYATTRAQIGLNPFDFSWQLAPGDSLQAPEAVLVYSNQGLNGMSGILHRLYRTRLCRGGWRDRERPVLINSWEAMYFNVSDEAVEKLGRTASELGIELLVLDDGWFGKRNDDRTSLGDWWVHREKFPAGLAPLAKRINAMGMQFGLWFEPEMISPDSDLYREHPDWCLHVPDRRRTTGRNQLVLDLSRAEVCDAIIEMVSEVLSSAPIGYVKWDMNRNLTEIGSASLPPERQRETAHRYMLGLYRVLETLTARFSEILFESCSGGGGRFDPGLFFYMPQAWTSDNTDAISRLRIQYGTSLAYPAICMGAHVSDSPNHQLGRTTPLHTRGAVAMGGTFGYELDLNKLSDAERTTIKHQVAVYKELRPLLQFGDFYRLKSPFESNETAWMFVSTDQSEAAVFTVHVLAEPNAPLPLLKLRGLDPHRDYLVREVAKAPTPSVEEQGHAVNEAAGIRETDLTLGGDALMSAGLRLSRLHGDFFAHIWHLQAL